MQGDSRTFTATVTNLNPRSGLPVYFSSLGANAVIGTGTTDAAGSATFSYTGVLAGSDTVKAVLSSANGLVVSNQVGVTWTAGPHVPSINLNASPQAGTVGRAVTLEAGISDGSATTPAALQGLTLNFGAGGASCSGTANSQGIAACTLTPTQVGRSSLTVRFGGNSSFTAASASSAFLVGAGSVPAPSVTLSINPASIVAGSHATLTWSSTGANACHAAVLGMALWP